MDNKNKRTAPRPGAPSSNSARGSELASPERPQSPSYSQPTAYDSRAPQPTVPPSRGLRATGGQHAAHTTADSGADAHGSRGLALGGGSRADRRRAAAAHARTRASGRTPVRLCLLRHRLQPPSCPPRPELEAKPPQLAVDLLPVRRRAAPRVHPGEPVADVVPRAARHAGVTVVEEEASRRHPAPPLRVDETLTPGCMSLIILSTYRA